MNIGWTEVLLIIAILVLLFGASKIPELARGVGEGISEFKDAVNNKEVEGDKSHNESTKANPREDQKDSETVKN
ncbi:MAG TPA: twin-arginine translocase TatA/TatE family subunit [Balneolaceae bacterium]|nr:twin-arginine translocase TatA/TatE family subunit [Balneolaceae bacterium]